MIKQLYLLTFLLSLGCISYSQNNYNEISLPDLMKKKRAGDANMVIVDVRTAREYHDTATVSKQQNIGHIKDAIHVDVRDLNQDPATALKKLEPYKDKDIYLICSHSYRSRNASNILMKNGFTHVSNVRGGMTEWFRRYDDMWPYMADFYETKNAYQNISPYQLLKQLDANKNVLLIGISSTPRFFYDTLTMNFYSYLPSFKNAIYYNYADSLKVLELVKKEKNRPVVLFNMLTSGAAETADWLTSKGIPQASYLVGSINMFYEYVQNKGLADKANKYLDLKNNIRFISSPVYCNMLKASKNIQLIDLRHDTLFNKVNNGTKYNFKHLKDAANFYWGLGEKAFIQKFPDKKKEYLLAAEYGQDGLELAHNLSKQGYAIYWLMGGTERWEWYMNNVETFSCNDRLVL